jgi:hypothetical protein
MTEASVDEYYASRDYTIDDAIIYPYDVDPPTAHEDKVVIHAVRDLAGFMHVTIQIIPFTQAGTPGSDAAWLIIRAGSYSGGWTGLKTILPECLWPAIATSVFFEFSEVHTAVTYFRTARATFRTDGIVSIRLMDTLTGDPLEHAYVPDSPIDAAGDITLPIFTFIYPTD